MINCNTTSFNCYSSGELMGTFDLAKSRGLVLKAATSTRELREQGGLFAVHDDPVYFTPWAPLMASNDLAEVEAYLRRR